MSGKYIPPHLRNKTINTTSVLTLSNPNTLILDGAKGVYVVPEHFFALIDNNVTYTYSIWILLESRGKGWCSVLHRGYAEFDRCPGLWLCAESNKLHLRVSSFNDKNFGIYESKSSIEIGALSHIAVSVDGIKKSIQLYVNGEFDCEKILDDETDTFVPGRGPLYLGRDIWHASSILHLSKFLFYNEAKSAEDIKTLFQSQRSQVEMDQTSVENVFSNMTVVTVEDSESTAKDDTALSESEPSFPSVKAQSSSKCNHSQRREAEIEISTYELDMARQHGDSYESDEKRVYTYNDMIHVTGLKDSKVITAWRCGKNADGSVNMNVPTIHELSFIAAQNTDASC